ncbi:hypothetical protein MRX96_032206 [Rhipicephalus microplus]
MVVTANALPMPICAIYPTHSASATTPYSGSLNWKPTGRLKTRFLPRSDRFVVAADFQRRGSSFGMHFTSPVRG